MVAVAFCDERGQAMKRFFAMGFVEFMSYRVFIPLFETTMILANVVGMPLSLILTLVMRFVPQIPAYGFLAKFFDEAGDVGRFMAAVVLWLASYAAVAAGMFLFWAVGRSAFLAKKEQPGQ